MSLRILIFAFCFLFIQDLKSQDTLAFWGFDEATGSTTKEKITNADYTIHTKWNTVERVEGIRKNALRTDGYTTWIDGNVNNTYPSDSFSFSAWIAPEVFPVDVAAIWSYFDTTSNIGAFLAINQFGNIVIKFSLNNQLISLSSSQYIEHYKWNFIVMNVDAINGYCNVFLNGIEIINQKFISGKLLWPKVKTFLARSSTSVFTQSIYPINFLNCIVDEILIRKNIWSLNDVTQEYLFLYKNLTTDLKTPKSRFINDFHRPKYHPIPNNGWANESHGLIRYNGVYHMFYQKNGNGPFFSQQNWGHLTSTDLVSWIEQKPALFPQPGWESMGNWSGHCVIDDNGIPTIMYTGVNGVFAGIGSAQSSNDLSVWNKNPANPLIPNAKSLPANKDFRDPYIFKEGSYWYMIVGSGLIMPSVGTIFLYKSNDLINWQYVRPLFTDLSGNNSVGKFWEMPVFYKFGSDYLLLVNKTPDGAIPANTFYWVGNFVNDTFTVSKNTIKNLELMNWMLSPSVNVDEQNRVIAIGIIPDLLPPSEQYENGWANLFSLPRVWNLQNDSLFQSPHPNLDKGRGSVINFNTISVTSASTDYLKLKGFQAEIKASIKNTNASKAGFILGKKNDNSEYTKVYYDYNGQSFVIDKTKSSINPNTPRNIQAEFFPFPSGTSLDWHIYIDGSVVEVFINNKHAFAFRIYPADSNSNIIDLFAEGGTATFSETQVWDRGDVSSYIITGLFDLKPKDYFPLKVYPNPSYDKCYIQLPEKLNRYVNACIYDVNGKKIRDFDKMVIQSKSYICWDIKNDACSRVPAGSYYFILNQNNKIYHARIIISPNN